MRHATSRALAVLAASAVAAFVAGLAEPAFAHGFAGKRFFPATLATDDPFVADELSLPTFSKRRTEEDGSSTTETTASVDFSKRVTRDFGVGVEATWLRLEPRDGTRVQGWDNFALSAKYQFYKSEPHETIVSVGVDADLGRHRCEPGRRRAVQHDYADAVRGAWLRRPLRGPALPAPVRCHGQHRNRRADALEQHLARRRRQPRDRAASTHPEARFRARVQLAVPAFLREGRRIFPVPLRNADPDRRARARRSRSIAAAAQPSEPSIPASCFRGGRCSSASRP